MLGLRCAPSLIPIGKHQTKTAALVPSSCTCHAPALLCASLWSNVMSTIVSWLPVATYTPPPLTAEQRVTAEALSASRRGEDDTQR